MSSGKSILSLSALDGTLSADEFYAGAHAFIDKWERASHDHDLPLWSWVSCRNLSFISSNEMDDDGTADGGEKEPSSLEKRDSSDPAMLVLPNDDEHYYDFHIAYSNSYRIPVLYFRGYHCDGQPLILDQILRDLPGNSVKLLMESKWTFITQQEHPYLNRPWFTLHPCGTNELMRLLFSHNSLSKEDITAEHYLISWVSVVGQMVGLSIPFQMAVSCQKYNSDEAPPRTSCSHENKPKPRS